MLEIFLQQIVAHPMAALSDKIHAFLQWPDEIRTAVHARASGFKLPPLPALDAGDPCRDAAKMLADFERQVGAIRDRFKRLQGRQSEDGLDLHELSQGVKEMSDNPMNMVLSVALSPLIEGLQSLASATKRQAQATKLGLLPKLKLHKQLAVAMQEQFKRRDAVGHEIDTLNSKVKDLLGQSTKLAGKLLQGEEGCGRPERDPRPHPYPQSSPSPSGKPGKEKKVADLEHQAAALQDRISSERDVYNVFTQVRATPA